MSREICDFTLDDGPVLVTGAGGFAGRRLMDLFQLGKGDIAVDFTDNFSAPPGVRKLAWKLPGPPPASLGQVRYVVHLAALSSVAHSNSSPLDVIRVNTEGTGSVLNWMNKAAPDALMLLASSAEVYRPSTEKLIESSPLGPRSSYGESKLKAEELVANSRLQCVIARSFPHFGPGQSGHFVLPSFCRRIIRSADREGKVISVGNLTAVRDYLFIDDVIRAYACLLANGQAGSVYNVCSGTGHSIGDILSLLVKISGAELSTVTDPGLLRNEDQFCQIGSPEKLKALGWTMSVPIKEGLNMLYQWWKERL